MGRELERAKSRIRDLEAELESARRAAKRQAAPFSKGPPVRRPARPGRQPGPAYGARARRSIPAPIDEVCDAPLPGRCPDCGGELAEIGVVSEEAAALLGKEYAGVLVRDGWAPCRKFSRATHQTCLAHLSRRCREMIADADRGGARVPHALARILKEALAIRDARDAGSVTREAARETAGALTAHSGESDQSGRNFRSPPVGGRGAADARARVTP